MIDFSIDNNNFEKSFLRIANELMNNYAIAVKNYYYRIVDCEFYYRTYLSGNLNEHKHDDIHTHGHNEQKKNGSWYFHGSGIDITIGNEKENSRGGILIRGIAKLSSVKNLNGNFILSDQNSIGPLKVLTTLFSHFENIFHKDNTFYLINKNEIKNFEFEKTDILSCPRKGLTQKSNDDIYYAKPYRFIVFPYLPHADKGKMEAYLVSKNILSPENAKALFIKK